MKSLIKNKEYLLFVVLLLVVAISIIIFIQFKNTNEIKNISYQDISNNNLIENDNDDNEISENEFSEDNVIIENCISNNIIRQTNEEQIREKQIEKNGETNSNNSTKKVVKDSTKSENKTEIQNKNSINIENKTQVIKKQDTQNKIQETSNVKTKNETKEETKKETKKEEQPKCTDNHHFIKTGNSGKWFSTKQEGIKYYEQLIDYWGKKWENFEIDDETYDKNCPYGYEMFQCTCGKWTINFYYR